MMTRWKQTACGILSGMLLLSGLAVPVWAEDATDPVTNEGDWVVDDITLDMQDDGTAWVTNCFRLFSFCRISLQQIRRWLFIWQSRSRTCLR